jgi:hypothetical protein
LLALSACTTAPPTQVHLISPTATPSVGLSTSAGTCHATSIKDGVKRFVRAWNRKDTTVVQRLLRVDAAISMSGKRQGAASPAAKSTDLHGWDEIRAFAQMQWDLGQQLSFASIAAVRRQGAYAYGMRSTYTDGSRQQYTDAKFAYSCTDSAFTRIVLVASKRAR